MLAVRRADYWCSVSRYTAEKTQQLFRLKARPIAILYNPIDRIAGSFPTARSTKTVVFSGRLQALKGVVSLIKAWPRVLKNSKDAELHVFGRDCPAADGSSMQSFLLSCLDHQSEASVQFHGHVPRARLYQALEEARLAVFPSFAEGFAIAPLEAMACGCPTIYTRRGSGPELIEPGRDGLLIDPDQPDEISDAILRLLTDDELAAQLGQAGQRRVQESFSLPSLLAENEQFYASCLSHFRRRSG